MSPKRLTSYSFGTSYIVWNIAQLVSHMHCILHKRRQTKISFLSLPFVYSECIRISPTIRKILDVGMDDRGETTTIGNAHSTLERYQQ